MDPKENFLRAIRYDSPAYVPYPGEDFQVGVQFEGKYYRINRSIVTSPSRVVVKDTITNTTAEPIGIIVANQGTLPGGDIERSYMAGLSSIFSTPEREIMYNPTLLVQKKGFGVGMVALDDVFIVQSLGAVDKLTIAGTDAYDWEFSDEYDFQAPGICLQDPVYNKIRALNNRAIFDQASWIPEGRARGGNPMPPWGGYLTQNYAYLMNALQRAGTYNYDSPVLGRNPDGSAIYGYNTGHLFVLYGRVSDTAGDFFKVDDGSGYKVDCYCPNASTKPIVNGQYVRMVGTLYGQNPYEWYFNMFHVVQWDPDPNNYVYSAMFPWRFDTYTWNVDVLQ